MAKNQTQVLQYCFNAGRQIESINSFAIFDLPFVSSNHLLNNKKPAQRRA